MHLATKRVAVLNANIRIVVSVSVFAILPASFARFAHRLELSKHRNITVRTLQFNV